MYDQSITPISLKHILRRSDFYRHYQLRDENELNKIIGDAAGVAQSNGWSISPFVVSKLKKKDIYALPKFSDKLLLRKLEKNIRRYRKVRTPARSSIIAGLARVISEGVSYNLYRLDVKSFFESFSTASALKVIDDIASLSLTSKKLLRNLYHHFSGVGGKGIPRGLAISSTLAELMMRDFDAAVRAVPNVFYFARYVDDIVLVTSGDENQEQFLRKIESFLPMGLELSSKKRDVHVVNHIKNKSTNQLSFEYLGYKFNVKDTGDKDQFRTVQLGIADAKIKKMKTRMVHAIRGYCEDKDFSLLVQRIRLLTGNFSIEDPDSPRMKLAGIFYNYHLISPGDQSSGLTELDKFWRSALLSGKGKVFAEFKSKLSSSQVKELLAHSFTRGFSSRAFVHYNRATMKKVQECWKYA